VLDQTRKAWRRLTRQRLLRRFENQTEIEAPLDAVGECWSDHSARRIARSLAGVLDLETAVAKESRWASADARSPREGQIAERITL